MGYEIEWIRVKDELPPENKEILLQTGCTICIGYRINCFKFELPDRNCPLDEVYAWSYLPDLCPVKYDRNTKHFTDIQFLGCLCNVLIELDKTTFYRNELEKEPKSPIDIVFAKLYNDNIVADFYFEDMFEIIEINSNSKICSCFNLYKNKITIDKKAYIKHFKDWFLQDLDVKVKEKIEKYLKEFFLNRKE